MLVCAAIGLAACVRDPGPDLCPNVAAGELVVTEIRGDQSGDDDIYGEWIEIYNASAGAVDVLGLQIYLQSIDGSSSGVILVRESFSVEAGDYFVIGHFPAGSEPEYVDYGYELACESHSSTCGSLPWFDAAHFYNAGAIDLVACGALIDRAIYRDLPSTGSWALDGTTAPSAEANDDEAAWCDDDREDGMPTPNAPGTPGEENVTCN